MGAGEFKPCSPSSNTSAGTSLIQNAGPGNSSPVAPVAGSTLSPIDCGDLDMQIARDGTWFYRGSPIGRIALVKLFASVLRREPDGRYWLVTPAERGRIEVEDVPFLAVALTTQGEGRWQQLIFRTNMDDIVTAGSDHPLRVETITSGEPAPYILVRNDLEARLTRPVFYDLVELGKVELIENDSQFGVWSQGRFFRLGVPGPDWE
jgi:uncharacterized protein